MGASTDVELHVNDMKNKKTGLIDVKPLSHETHGPCDCGNVC